MDSVIFYWTNDVIFYWTNKRIRWFQSNRGSVVNEGITTHDRNYLDPSEYYLNDVIEICKQFKLEFNFPDGTMNVIGFPITPTTFICVFPIKFCPISDETHFLTDLETYFKSAGVDNVRFIYFPFFSATIALRQFQKSKLTFNRSDKILLVNSSQFAVCDLENVFYLKNTNGGWRLKNTHVAQNVHPTLYGSDWSIPDAFVNEIKESKYVVFFVKHSTDTRLLKIFTSLFGKSKLTIISEDSKETIFDAASYLIGIYSSQQEEEGMKKDLSCFVPMCFHWPISFCIPSELNTCNEINMFSEMDALPCMKILPNSHLHTSKTIIHVHVSNGVITRTYELPSENAKSDMKVKFYFGLNGGFSILVEKKSELRYLPIDLDNPPVVEESGYIFTIKRKHINAKYWKNGLLTDVVDQNGLIWIPLKVSFIKDTPVVGSAADDYGMKPIRHELFKLCDPAWVRQQIEDGATDLCFDADGNVNVIVETPHGLRKITPTLMLAVIVKSMNKLVEKSTYVDALGATFNFELGPFYESLVPDLYLIRRLVFGFG